MSGVSWPQFLSKTATGYIVKLNHSFLSQFWVIIIFYFCTAVSCSYRQSYNVAPGTFLPVVYCHVAAAGESQQQKATTSAGGGVGESDGKGKKNTSMKREEEEEEDKKQADEREGGGPVLGSELPVGGGVSEAFQLAAQHAGVVGVRTMKWGLVPSFTSRSAKPDHFKMVRRTAVLRLQQALIGFTFSQSPEGALLASPPHHCKLGASATHSLEFQPYQTCAANPSVKVEMQRFQFSRILPVQYLGS